jgi:drug/metabolite transporter (DMT)-like permease
MQFTYKPIFPNTLIGYLAQLMWASLPILLIVTQHIPSFEILSIAFTISFLLTVIKLFLCNEFYKVKQPIIIWLIGIVGIVGNECLFVTASKYAPIDHLTIIFNLWPLLLFLLSSFFLGERFSSKFLLASLICIICLLIGFANNTILSISNDAYIGYAIAFTSAFLWSIYVLSSRYCQRVPIEMVGMYCGVGAIICGFLHFQFETTIAPSFIESNTIILMGLTTEGAAYFLWDRGIKHGNYKILCLLAYTNPVLSVILLALFGFTELTVTILLASLLIITTNMIVGYKYKHDTTIKSFKKPLPTQTSAYLT